jgi:hypothetical protein
VSKRSLAILSDGLLSESQRRSLTLISLGWLELIYPPKAEEEDKKRRMGMLIETERNDASEIIKKLREEDNEILAIIYTFMECQ